MKSSLPLVSIALCTYNGGKYLPEQIRSLLDQTYPNIEIVIVDDNSSDNTHEVLKEFNNEVNIRFYFNSSNLGFVKNFEKAISLCQGEYIALSDQDDIWKKEKIELLVNKVDKNILVYANSEIIDKTGNSLNKRLSSIRNFVNGSDPIPFIFHNCIPGHTMMFHKRLIDYILPFPSQLKFHDWWIAFVAASVGKILYIDECLVMYRQHEATNTDILKARKTKIKEVDKSLKLERITNDIIDKIAVFRDFKHLKPKDREVLTLMAEGYQLRIGAYFSPKLFGLLFKYRNDIYYIPKYSTFKKLLYVVKESWGTKTKKLFYKVKELF